MRALAVLVLAGLLAAPALAACADPAEQQLSDLVLDCVRSHAAEVERVEPTLTEATNFILDDLCHVQINTHERYLRNRALLERMKSPQNLNVALAASDEDGDTKGDRDRARRLAEQAHAQWQSASVDPSTGELTHAPAGDPMAGFEMVYEIADAHSGVATEPFRAAAAEAVLAARTARLGKQP